MREVVRALTLLGLRELISELGGNIDALASEVRLDLRGITGPEQFISNRKVHELVNLAAERLNRKDLGLLWGARSDPTRLGPLYVALANAETGRQAFELIVRFLHINFPTGSVTLKPLAGGQRELIAVRTRLTRPPPLIQFYERRVGSLHVLLKMVCGPDYRPDEIWFAHEKQSPFATYQAVFGIRPAFGMPENGIVVRRKVLEAIRPAANAQVREMAVSFLKSRSPPPHDGLVAEAAHMVDILMRSSNCTSAQTAHALGMHPRTLQRRLLEEGTTFEAIKDKVRRNLAEAMLAEANVSVTTIALNLHYSNASAFTRRCKVWFGKPPRMVRQQLIRRAERRQRARGQRGT